MLGLVFPGEMGSFFFGFLWAEVLDIVICGARVNARNDQGFEGEQFVN